MSVPLLTSAALGSMRGVVHGFTTRHGGVSVGPRESLNLAVRPGSDRAAVAKNWQLVAQSLGSNLGSQDVALVDQVHGADVLRIHAATGALRTAGAADAVVSTQEGILLAVRTADCVPVLLACPGGVAAAHAGWRGLVAGVLPQVVQALAEAAGVRPEAMVAAVGPHIGVRSYEVGPEVVDALVEAGLERELVAWMGPGRREHADLGVAAAEQLRMAGVGTVERVDPCTFEDPRFYSHRRDGQSTGRLGAVIGRYS